MFEDLLWTSLDKFSLEKREWDKRRQARGLFWQIFFACSWLEVPMPPVPFVAIPQVRRICSPTRWLFRFIAAAEPCLRGCQVDDCFGCYWCYPMWSSFWEWSTWMLFHCRWMSKSVCAGVWPNVNAKLTKIVRLNYDFECPEQKGYEKALDVLDLVGW